MDGKIFLVEFSPRTPLTLMSLTGVAKMRRDSREKRGGEEGTGLNTL